MRNRILTWLHDQIIPKSIRKLPLLEEKKKNRNTRIHSILAVLVVYSSYYTSNSTNSIHEKKKKNIPPIQPLKDCFSILRKKGLFYHI